MSHHTSLEDLPAVPACKLVNTRLGTVPRAVSNGATVNTLDLDTLVQGTLFLAAARDVAHFCQVKSASSSLFIVKTRGREKKEGCSPPQLEHFGI